MTPPQRSEEADRLRARVALLVRNRADPVLVARARRDLVHAEIGDQTAREVAACPRPTAEQADRLRGLLWGANDSRAGRRESEPPIEDAA
jgi:hypothetical protein